MIDRIIWDWNGTLLNDVNRNCALMNRMLRRRGMPAIPSLIPLPGNFPVPHPGILPGGRL